LKSDEFLIRVSVSANRGSSLSLLLAHLEGRFLNQARQFCQRGNHDLLSIVRRCDGILCRRELWAPLTLPFNIGDGGATNSFTGSVNGSITAVSKPQTTDGSVRTAATIAVTDLDLRIRRRGSGLTGFLIPSINANNLTANAALNLNPASIGINIPTTAINSTLSGGYTITGDNNLTDTQLGVVGGLQPGSDNAWDDSNEDGQFDNLQVNGFNASLNSPINATVNVTGGLSGGVANDVVIPNIYNTGLINIGLRLKNSSTFSIAFDPVQNLSITGLSISTTDVLPVNTPTSNFIEGTHPLDDGIGNPVLDLSSTGGAVVATTISGTLNADIKGLVSASIDLAADVRLIGIINFPINIDNAIDGLLTPTSVDLLTLTESVTLPDVDLPFFVTVLHNPTTNVDYDDVAAAIASGTFGLTLPFTLNETDVVIEIPTITASLPATSFNFGSGATSGTAFLDNLTANLSNAIVTDINANLGISANVIASALRANAINVPEASSMLLTGLGSTGILALATWRRRASRKD
jgi:hypothetical protein